MRVGIWTMVMDDGIRPAELGRAVEERGFDSLFVGEHSHLPAHTDEPLPSAKQERIHARQPDPLVLLGLVAGATTRLRLGTAVLLAAQRDPIITAKAVATLDRLSDGRLELGVGTGWHRGEMRNHGIDPAKRGAALRERVMAMQRIWADEEAEYHGDQIDFGPLYSWPKPVQRPLPVLAGGTLRAAWPRIAKYADGWLPMYGGDPAATEREVAELRERSGDRRVPVTLLGVPPEPRLLERLAAAGVDRVLPELPRADRDTTLRTLDGFAEVVPGGARK